MASRRKPFCKQDAERLLGSSLQEGEDLLEEWDKLVHPVDADRDVWFKLKHGKATEKKLTQMATQKTHDTNFCSARRRLQEKIKRVKKQAQQWKDQLCSQGPEEGDLVTRYWEFSEKVDSAGVFKTVRAADAIVAQNDASPEKQRHVAWVCKALDSLREQSERMDSEFCSLRGGNASLENDELDDRASAAETLRLKLQKHSWHTCCLEALLRELHVHGPALASEEKLDEVRASVESYVEEACGAEADDFVVRFFYDEGAHAYMDLNLPIEHVGAGDCLDAQEQQQDFEATGQVGECMRGTFQGWHREEDWGFIVASDDPDGQLFVHRRYCEAELVKGEEVCFELGQDDRGRWAALQVRPAADQEGQVAEGGPLEGEAREPAREGAGGAPAARPVAACERGRARSGRELPEGSAKPRSSSHPARRSRSSAPQAQRPRSQSCKQRPEIAERLNSLRSQTKQVLQCCKAAEHGVLFDRFLQEFKKKCGIAVDPGRFGKTKVVHVFEELSDVVRLYRDEKQTLLYRRPLPPGADAGIIEPMELFISKALPIQDVDRERIVQQGFSARTFGDTSQILQFWSDLDHMRQKPHVVIFAPTGQDIDLSGVASRLSGSVIIWISEDAGYKDLAEGSRSRCVQSVQAAIALLRSTAQAKAAGDGIAVQVPEAPDSDCGRIRARQSHRARSTSRAPKSAPPPEAQMCSAVPQGARSDEGTADQDGQADVQAGPAAQTAEEAPQSGTIACAADRAQASPDSGQGQVDEDGGHSQPVADSVRSQVVAGGAQFWPAAAVDTGSAQFTFILLFLPRSSTANQRRLPWSWRISKGLPCSASSRCMDSAAWPRCRGPSAICCTWCRASAGPTSQTARRSGLALPDHLERLLPCTAQAEAQLGSNTVNVPSSAPIYVGGDPWSQEPDPWSRSRQSSMPLPKHPPPPPPIRLASASGPACPPGLGGAAEWVTYDRTVREDVVRIDQLKYTQYNINSTFSDGREFDTLIAQLDSGEIDPMKARFLRLEVVKVYGGQGECTLFCNDNRRLYCLKEHARRQAKPVCIRAEIHPWNGPSTDAACGRFAERFNTRNGGEGIAIRGKRRESDSVAPAGALPGAGHPHPRRSSSVAFECAQAPQAAHGIDRVRSQSRARFDVLPECPRSERAGKGRSDGAAHGGGPRARAASAAGPRLEACPEQARARGSGRQRAEVSSIDSPGAVELAGDASAERIAAKSDASLDVFEADRPATKLQQPGAADSVARPRTPPSPSEASTRAPTHSAFGSAPSSPCSSKEAVGDTDISSGVERAPCATGPIADLRDIISWRKQGLLDDMEFAAAKRIALGLPM
ncbi:unnamed protein product [Prorocentrum cordatum]|uniref:HTH OST-type domain-containing protein n=1 Tax=Prorocentrum cordatum TaxID=2364126 RepID=A0ABN9XLT2_9DINO|nr:unnamed protein product [Polarella glacialis]